MINVIIEFSCVRELDYKDTVECVRGHLSHKYSVLQEASHTFISPPKVRVGSAFTYCFILGESHCVISTYPEKKSMFLHMSLCSENINKSHLYDMGIAIAEKLGLQVVRSSVEDW